MKIIKLLTIPAFLIVGCNSKKDHANSNDIAGTYVMEKTYEVRHEATGDPVGMATIRDTIIIAKIMDGYEVKNRKWKKNEFDEEGWVKLEHDALPLYHAKFQQDSRTLTSVSPSLFGVLEVNKEKKLLLKGMTKQIYVKL